MKLLGLLISLTFLVITHEFGHYIFARIFKTRVEKFYIFFNWGFSILRMKRINGKFQFSFFSKQSPESWNDYPDNTEWGIGWLPLGGYCSIAGMVDETKSADDLPSEPQPWEFRSKKSWQRFLILIGGVSMNFISALIIYSAIMFNWGEEYMPIQNCKYGIYFSESAQDLGFQSGDKIISVGGETPRDLPEFTLKIYLDDPQNVVVQRDSIYDTISIPAKYAKDNLKKLTDKPFCTPEFPFVIDSVMPESPAALAHLQSNDSIISIDDTTSALFYDIQEYLELHGSEKVMVSFYRDDSLYTESIKLTDEGKLGVFPKNPYSYLNTNTLHYNFWESIPRGIKMGFNQLAFYVKQFKLIFSKEGVKQMGGFGTMGKLFPNIWDWSRFWNTTALFAIILAFMNVVPIPGLDGGYLLFILVEMITGKKPGDKFMTYANAVGLALILMLVIYANGMDVFRYFFK